MNKFFYKQFAPHLRSVSRLIGPVARDLTEGGRFYFNLSRATGMESYVFRDGEWSDPFESLIDPICVMPKYDSNFSLSFEEVSDNRALDIKSIINNSGRVIIVKWSGGIDSTVSLVSLLKNLSESELKRIKISLSSDSILEYPAFFIKYIKDKFEIIDSEKVLFENYLTDYNSFCISADTGDCMFGAELGNKMYPRMKFISEDTDLEVLYNSVSNKDVHYSRYKDIIISHFNRNLKLGVEKLQQSVLHNDLGGFNDADKNFGELFYEKIVNNIKTSSVPIHSLHDFFWWTIFNGRFVHCSLRAPVIYSTVPNKKDLIHNCLIQWYNSDKYQQWSMNNNNNNTKLLGPTQGLYKTAAKQYIYNYTKDDWYYHHKIKIISLPNIINRNWRKNLNEFDPLFGIDQDYNSIKIDNLETKNFVLDRIFSYSIDW